MRPVGGSNEWNDRRWPVNNTESKHVEQLGFKEHAIRIGDGKGGWRSEPAEYQFLHVKGADRHMPFGIVQMDNGQTWDIASRYILDEFEFFDGKKWFNGETGHLCSTLLSDGHILTAYGNYITGGADLVRWQP